MKFISIPGKDIVFNAAKVDWFGLDYASIPTLAIWFDGGKLCYEYPTLEEATAAFNEVNKQIFEAK